MNYFQKTYQYVTHVTYGICSLLPLSCSIHCLGFLENIIQSDLVYPDHFVLSNKVGLLRCWIIGIKSIKSEILSRANVNNVKKGDNVQYSRTSLRGCSKGNRTEL